MKVFAKILCAADGAQVVFIKGRDPASKQPMLLGLTLDAEGCFVDTRMQLTAEQVDKLFVDVDASSVEAMRRQAERAADA